MPIRRKMALVIVVTCSIGVLLACGLLALFELNGLRGALECDTTALADILAKTTQASLAFEDDSAAAQTMRALNAEPNITAACLYSQDGTRFAEYSRANSKAEFPEKPPTDGVHFGGGKVTIVRPVLLNDRRIGTIYLSNDLEQLYHRVNVFTGFAILVWIGSCVIALLLAVPLQQAISHPLIVLTDSVRAIAGRKDYTGRLPETRRDEIGSLTGAFNQFLGSIEDRDKALLAANESLRSSQTQLQTIVESLAEGLIVSDLQGNLMHFNRAALDLHGFATLDECKRQFTALADTFELSSVNGTVWTVDQWPFSRILRGEKLRNLEARVRRLKAPLWQRIFNYGGTLVSDASGKPMMAVVTTSDITERKQAEAKVGEQLARLALLNQITRATGERLDLASVFQVVVGTMEDQLRLHFCCICLHDTAAEELTVAALGPRSQTLALELSMRVSDRLPVGKDGLNRCARGQLVYEPDGSISAHTFSQKMAKAGLHAFVAAPLSVESKAFGILIAARHEPNSFSSGECEFLRQLTEQVALAAHQAQLHTALQQAYDDLRQTQQAVMQQERLRALGQMASGIAHDINNAISPVALYTESLLETEPNLSSRARDYLHTIQHSIEDVSQTVARMREFYRQRETQLSLVPVQLNPLLKQVIDLSRARWSDMPQQRGIFIDLETDFAPDLPEIAGVESELREAFLNLVFNAVDAMPEGGRLTLRTKILPREGDVGNHGRQSIAVEVCDSGLGMDEDTRRRCLEPFFTTKGERGTGLGLAMVYGIAQRHAADIEIDSEPGEGTIFRLVFTTPAKPLRPAPPAAPASAPHSRLRLLIVDDDPLLTKSLRDTLESDGHTVVTAGGGQAGIDTFREAMSRHDSFDIVITDLGMPYVDGRKVANAIKTASPATPVILLTGWAQRLMAEGDMPSHVDQILNKPPKLRELRQALADCEARLPLII